MKKSLTIILFLLGIVQLYAQTISKCALEVIGKSIEAPGGRNKINSINNLQLSGSGYRNALEQSERFDGPYIPLSFNFKNVMDFEDTLGLYQSKELKQMKIKETGFILFLENYEENVKFYIEKLGLKLREKKEGLSKLDFGGSYLMIEDKGVFKNAMIEDTGAFKSVEKTRDQNPTVIRIEVQDFEETIREIKGRGITIQVHKFDWGTIGVIIDPEGNRIEIKD